MSATAGTDTARPKWVGVSAAMLGLVGLAGFAWTWILSAAPIDPPEQEIQ